MAELQPDIVHLFEHPEHRAAAAALIHQEFWTAVTGASASAMQARLATADRADRVPLALIALHQGAVIGAINLVDNDDEDHPDWHPWLAGMVVAEPWRGRGVGSALVLALLGHARRLGFERVYLGTDGPGFYARLGAVVQAAPRPDFCFMRFDL